MLPRSAAVVFQLFACCWFICLSCQDGQAGTERDRAIIEIQQLIVRGELIAASDLLAESRSKFPGDAGLDNLSGVLAAEQHRYADAESCFLRAVERDPKLTPAYLNLGRLYQENPSADPHSAQKALGAYQHVLKYDVQNVEANYQSAVLLLHASQYQQSLIRLRHLASGRKQTAQVLSIMCADYAALGERRQATDSLARLTASPDFSEPDVREMLSGLRAGKRHDLIVDALLSLRKRGPLPPDLQHALGLAYEASGELDEARSALEQFFAAGTPAVSPLMELARVAYEQRDYKGSLGYVAHARDLEPSDASIHYSFGVICVQLDLIAEARNSFEKAVKLEPDNATYNYAMGMISSFNRAPEDAAPYLRRYIQLNPKDPRAKLALGADFLRSKNYEAASPWLDQAVKDPRTATVAHYYLGSLALQTQHPDQAAIHLKLALKARPDYPDALAELGHCYLTQHNYLAAEKQLRRALELDPDHLVGNFYLITLYARTNDPRQQAQSKHYADLLKQQEEKMDEFLRMVTVQPFIDTQP
jgi:tetratricopeptide (TPR) repeat protein